MICKPLVVQIVLLNVQFRTTSYKLVEMSHHLIHARSL